MPDRVNLVRPDGSILQVSSENAAKLKELGSDYQEESLESNITRNAEIGVRNYYEDQKLETFAEGVGSGLTLGASDYLTENVLGWDTSERAEYNPGTRLAGEIVGSVAPALVPGGGAAVLAKTPAGLLSSAAKAAGAGRATRAGQMAVAGAVEGAVAGVAAQGVNATLSGDPLTAEAVLAGVGWGAVLGGGIGGFLGKASSSVDDFAKARAAGVAEEARTFPHTEWNTFRSSISSARNAAADAVKTVESKVAAATTSNVDHAADLIAAHQAREGVQSKVFGELDVAGKTAKVRTVRDSMIDSMKVASAAAAKGDIPAFKAAMDTHAAKLRNLETAAGRTPMDLGMFTYEAAAKTTPALEEVKNLALVRDALNEFPSTAEGFIVTKKPKMETHIAAIDKLMSTGGAELEGVRTAVKEAVAKMAETSGVKIEGTVGEQVRGLWEIGTMNRKVAGKEAIEHGARGGFFSRTARYAAGRGAVAASGATSGAGKVAAYASGSLVIDAVVGLKSAVTGTIADGVAKWGPRAGRVAQKTNVAARYEPLSVRLDGTTDTEKKTRLQLMQDRAEEFRRNAGTVRDTLYRSVEGIAASHPQFAAALIEAGDKQFQAVAAMLPRDPGTAFSRMKSMWKADPVAIEKFARVYEVFQNPVAVAKRALATGDITPEAAATLRKTNPEIFQMMRVGMLERLAEPGNLEKLSYAEQVSLGRLLDITIHSTQTPRFIAAQQAMFQERNEPLTARPPGGSASNNPSGGRPPGASAASAITEH